jgi:tetratricopeptide (TPR) repeat protein
MKPSRRITVILAAILIVCLAAAVLTVTRADRVRPAATLEEVLYIPSPKIIQRMSLGYTGLLADIYWTRAVQYFGRKHFLRAHEYKLLAPLLNITTQLDPHLIVAYEFGSIFLTQPPPQGAGDPDAAIRLVQYGVTHNPDDWHLYYNLGFIYYLDKKDYLAAAKAFDQGSKVPNAHPFLKVLAARMAERGGDVETARLLWTTTYESTQDKQIKANAVSHLRALQVDEVVPKLEDVIARYAQRSGHPPQSWAELIRAGYLPGVPLDPIGNPYKLVPGGKVQVAIPDDLPFITKGLPPDLQASEKPKH